jgi:stage V sporulation protein B
VIPNVTTAVFPAVSEFKADKERLDDLYIRVSKAVLLIVLPIAVVLVVFPEKILRFWMGSDFAAHGAVALRFMAVAYLLSALAAVPGVFAEGLGRPGIPAFFAGIGAVANICLVLVFIPKWGISGPALVLILNGLVAVPLFIDRVNRKVLGMRFSLLLRKSYAKPFLAACLLLLFFLALESWAKNLVQLGGLVAGGTALYALACLRFGIIDAVERRIIWDHWRSLTGGGSKHAS